MKRAAGEVRPKSWTEKKLLEVHFCGKESLIVFQTNPSLRKTKTESLPRRKQLSVLICFLAARRQGQCRTCGWFEKTQLGGRPDSRISGGAVLSLRSCDQTDRRQMGCCRIALLQVQWHLAERTASPQRGATDISASRRCMDHSLQPMLLRCCIRF